MAITLLICTHNGQRTIGEAIASCKSSLEASGSSGEILVVDNGSTAWTHKIVASQAEKGNLRILSVPTPGKIHAFGARVPAASHDLIWAGMTFRRGPLIGALDAGYCFYNDGQRGKGMRVSGEFNQIRQVARGPWTKLRVK